MVTKVIIVYDLDVSRSGNGGVIHKLAGTAEATVVFKFGGGQNSHSVVDKTGKEFNFSHWGCATFEGIPTYIMPKFIAIPRTIVDEGKALKLLGIEDPYSYLSVDPSVLCVTSFHQIASQLLELSKQDQPSIEWASGANEAYRISEQLGEDYSLRFCDLRDDNILNKKLKRIMEFYQSAFAEFDMSLVSVQDRERATNLLNDLLNDYEIVRKEFLRFVDIICNSSITLQTAKKALNDYDGIAICECSHGILADAKRGLKPGEVAQRTLPKYIEESLFQAGFKGEIKRYGVTKACVLRHGGVSSLTTSSESADLFKGSDVVGDLVVPDPDELAFRERWQDTVQYGPLDLPLLERAIKLGGGPQAFDGLCVTWLDQVARDGKEFKYCDRYLHPYHVTKDGEMISGDPEKAIPYISSFYDLKHTTVGTEDFNRAIIDFFEKRLGIPVIMLSFGKKDNDKLVVARPA